MNKEDNIIDKAIQNLTNYTGLKAYWKAGKESVDAYHRGDMHVPNNPDLKRFQVEKQDPQ